MTARITPLPPAFALRASADTFPLKGGREDVAAIYPPPPEGEGGQTLAKQVAGRVGGAVTRVSLIVAVSRNGVIGNKGKLPWHIPADLKHFKAMTMGKPVIMGRKTWDSLEPKPLPGRTNIVITRDKSLRAEGATVVHSFDEALAKARGENPQEIMILGGEAIFAAALPIATRVYLTAIEGDFEGDARMPLIDRRVFFEATYDGPHETTDGLGYSFLTLERK